MLVGMNISVEQGEDAIFACHTKNLGNILYTFQHNVYKSHGSNNVYLMKNGIILFNLNNKNSVVQLVDSYRPLKIILWF